MLVHALSSEDLPTLGRPTIATCICVVVVVKKASHTTAAADAVNGVRSAPSMENCGLMLAVCEGNGLAAAATGLLSYDKSTKLPHHPLSRNQHA